MNEMINAVRYDRILDFRERYRVASTCCSSTTFSSWPARKARRPSSSIPSTRSTISQKQIVISSDCPPHEIPQLEERLRSRFRVGPHRRHSARRISRRKVAILEEASGNRRHSASRQRRAIYIAGKDQVEHPRARGLAHPADCACVADRPGDFTRAYAGRAAERPAARRTGGDDRGESEVRLRLLSAQARGLKSREQLEVDRDASTDRHVSV